MFKVKIEMMKKFQSNPQDFRHSGRNVKCKIITLASCRRKSTIGLQAVRFHNDNTPAHFFGVVVEKLTELLSQVVLRVPQYDIIHGEEEHDYFED